MKAQTTLVRKEGVACVSVIALASENHPDNPVPCLPGSVALLDSRKLFKRHFIRAGSLRICSRFV